VLFLEPLGEFPNSDGASLGIASGGGILAILGGGDDGDRPTACLLAGEDGAWSEADAARSSPGTVLYNVLFATTGQDAQPEAGQVLVPEKILARLVGGAGVSLDAAAVARARPDGYTILLGPYGLSSSFPTAMRFSINS
jgi:hypothetical protein